MRGSPHATSAKNACDALAKEIYGNIFLTRRSTLPLVCIKSKKDGSMTSFGIVDF
jgi:hypothetical protein